MEEEQKRIVELEQFVKNQDIHIGINGKDIKETQDSVDNLKKTIENIKWSIDQVVNITHYNLDTKKVCRDRLFYKTIVWTICITAGILIVAGLVIIRLL